MFEKILSSKMIRFVLVSGLNTAFGYGLFAFFIYAGIHYTISAILSTILGILFNFKTIGWLVFENKNNNLVIKFFGVYAITYVLSIVTIALLKKFDINEYRSGALLLVPMGIVAFVLNKFWVFKEKDT